MDTDTEAGGYAVKPAQKADIDIERATYEDNLVRQHLPLVQYVVSEVAHRVPSHVSRNDLVSAGMLGLAQAARSYDPERGIAFDRFASTRIRGALLDELRGRDWASRSVRARARGLQAAHEELTNKLGRTPTPEEVATMLDVPTETVHKLVDDVHRATVLNYDSLVLEGDAESFIAGDDGGPEEAILDRERKAYLIDAVRALPERLQRVVHRLLLRRAFDAGPRRRARRERVAHLAAARRSAAAPEGRHQLAARARRRAGGGAPERAGRPAQGRVLLGGRRRLVDRAIACRSGRSRRPTWSASANA